MLARDEKSRMSFPPLVTQLIAWTFVSAQLLENLCAKPESSPDRQ
jgi:hypothetical protein